MDTDLKVDKSLQESLQKSIKQDLFIVYIVKVTPRCQARPDDLQVKLCGLLLRHHRQ